MFSGGLHAWVKFLDKQKLALNKGRTIGTRSRIRFPKSGRHGALNPLLKTRLYFMFLVNLGTGFLAQVLESPWSVFKFRCNNFSFTVDAFFEYFRDRTIHSLNLSDLGTEYHLLEQYLRFSLETSKKRDRNEKKEIEGIKNNYIQINQINK